LFLIDHAWVQLLQHIISIWFSLIIEERSGRDWCTASVPNRTITKGIGPA
jgi:hypothetical protein